MKSNRLKYVSITLLFAWAANLAAANSDEFDDDIDLLVNNTSQWSVLGSGDMDERATTISINSGLLTVVPQIFSMNSWFQDEYGPLVYQEVTGNFAAAIHLRMSQTSDIDQPPDVGFNAGGFVIRDPSGTHTNNENWVMYNFGGQGQNGVTLAREMKKTVGSTSNLFLTEQIDMEEYLLACRVGDVFYFYYWADAIGAWRQETFYNQFDVDGVATTTWRNSNSVTPEIIAPGPGQASPIFFDHPGMPQTVQLGLMAGAWSNSNNGVRGDFNFIRLAAQAPQSQSDCTTAFENIDQSVDLIFADDFEAQTAFN